MTSPVPVLHHRSAVIGACLRGLTARIGLATALAAGSLAAQDRSLEIDRFHADLEVRENGDLHVLESITVRFVGSWNGLIRRIPTEYRTPQGLRYRLFLDVTGVTGEAGSPLEYEESRDGLYRHLRIRVPGAQDAIRTVNIRYEVPNALKFFDEHDELYWNVTGSEWPIPIHAASARVTLPDDASARRATAFTGAYGSTQQGVAEQIEEGFYFEAGRGLSMREGLTIAVAWDPGVVARPGLFERLMLFLRSNLLFVLPLLSTALMARIWHARGRDPALRPIVPAYEPPEGLTPSEAGTLIDNRPDMRDVTAAVVDLAVRGYLRIEEEETKRLLGLVSDTEYRFVRTRDPEAWHDLTPHERTLLAALFSGRSSVRMSDLEHSFYEDLPKIRDRIFDRLVELKLYDRRPDKVLGQWIGIGVLVLVLSVGFSIVLANALLLSRGWSILAAVLTALPVFVFGALMPARNLRGARKLEEILGFQEFLDRVEGDRFRRMIDSPEAFERYLPFAMAFGVDHKWAEAFDEIYKEPPAWYVGRHPAGFRTSLFVSNLSDWSSSVGQAMASQPRSTGGSAFGGGGGGFSGGGFSGGGFGGGGGGGW